MFAVPRPKKSLLPPQGKKRKIEHKIEEITFDKDARTEYLTGFRKRKQARIKQAQEIAQQKARQERIDLRKQVSYPRPFHRHNSAAVKPADSATQVREERKQQLEDHVQHVNKLLREAQHAGTEEGTADESEEEWDGISDNVPEEPPLDREEEYIDEDRYTTVTIEAVNIDRDGIHKPGHESEEAASDEDLEGKKTEADSDGKEAKKPRKEFPKKKKKKFRYETKAERGRTEKNRRAKNAR